MLLLACVFLNGILLRKTGAVSIIGIGLILFLYATPWKERGIRLLILVAGIPLMLVLGCLRMNYEECFRKGYLTKIEDGQLVRLAGKIDYVEEKPHCFYYYLTDCSLELSDSEMHLPCNDVLAYVSSDDYSVGQILILQGTISLFDKATNEGQFDARAYYQSRKIDFGLWVDEIEHAKGKPSRFRNAVFAARELLRRPLEKYADDGGVLSAMLLGDKTNLESEIKTLYQQAGIAHVLAISGLHVSLLGMTLYRLLRHQCRLTYFMSATVVFAFLISYTIMTGNAISARRAAGMLMVFLLADMLGRSYDMLSALALLMIVLLWENPYLTENSGFWFSIAAVAGVGIGQEILVEPIRLRYTDKDGRISRRGRRLEGVVLSASIQLFTIPLVAYSYYEIPVYAMLLNVPVLALAPYVLGMAALGAAVGQFHFAQPMSALMCRLCSVILKGYDWLCEASLSLPNARVITGKPTLSRMFFYYALLGMFLYLFWVRMKRKQRMLAIANKSGQMELSRGASGGRSEKLSWKEKMPWKAGLAYGMCLLMLASVLFAKGKPGFELDILDVEQGDAIYLCTPDGVSMMMDGGSTDVKNIGTYRILPFLKSKAIRKISYWFISHTDEDHISGIKEVIGSGYQVDTLVLAEAQKEDEKAGQLVTLAEAYGTQIVYMKAGDMLQTRESTLQCLYPRAQNKCEDLNDRCLVLQYEDTNFSGFFGGDISSEVEEELVRERKCKDVDFLKVSHHGSKYSSCDAFLQVLTPLIAVISVGKENQYGHPHGETLDRLENIGTKVLRTDESGAVKIKIAGGCGGFLLKENK